MSSVFGGAPSMPAPPPTPEAPEAREVDPMVAARRAAAAGQTVGTDDEDLGGAAGQLGVQEGRRERRKGTTGASSKLS